MDHNTLVPQTLVQYIFYSLGQMSEAADESQHV
jgi:hypothetical protein